MAFAYWSRKKGERPGLWAIRSINSADEAATAVKQRIPSLSGYIDGIALGMPGGVDLEAVKQAVVGAVSDARPLEMPLDVIFIIGDKIANALRFPAAEPTEKE